MKTSTWIFLSRPWPVFRALHRYQNLCVCVITKRITRIMAGESKIDIVPAFSGGPGSISL